MSCTADRNRLAPGTWASLGRRRAITWSAEILRSLKGFSVANTKPELVEKPPVKPATLSIAGSCAHDLHELPELPAHRLEGDALVGADAADDAAGVLLREEALGDGDIEMDVQDHRRQEHQHGRQRMAQHEAQAVAVPALQGGEAALAPAEEAARPPRIVMRPQHVGAHHRRGGERHHHRDQDGDRQRDGELAEQPADDAAHQQDGDEHRDQRHAHRHHGEADLARALQRRLDAASCRPRCGARRSPARRWRRRPRSPWRSSAPSATGC